MIYSRLNDHSVRQIMSSIKLLNNQKLTRCCCSLQAFKQPADSKNAQWKVLFFGTDDFALVSLKKLHKEYRSKRLVNRLEAVTAYEGDENSILKYAREHGIKVHNWPLQISLAEFHIGLVVSFGHLIPTRIIQSFPLGMLNLHASLLPRWRGAAPVIYALMNGDESTGVTVMKVAPKKFDVGEILAQRQVEIRPDECQPELHNKLANIGGDLLIEIVEKLPDIIHSAKPQSNGNVTYAPKIKKEISIIKWEKMTAKDVYNLQRALTGIFPLKTTFQGKNMKLFGIKVPTSLPKDVYFYNLNPGIVFYDKEKHLLMVQCKQGDWITVEYVLLSGKKRMSANDFNNGFIKNDRDKVIILGNEKEINVNRSIYRRM